MGLPWFEPDRVPFNFKGFCGYNRNVMHNGFNTNVPYKGKMYHVQTEDGGARNPVLTTMLYHKGEILETEKNSYAEVLVDDDWKDKVLERMKEQHRNVIKKLMAGQFTGEAQEAEVKKELSLEDSVIEHILGPGA